ncbi:hypothetical protein E2C01_083256 [Portunus trituberculatus]|uniref:Uncharacterized protein n=1 Tax=Portunus trituberculatus TaxID=210409 RepID=A0A5B7J0P9_PORTR|nr:hypothetical protein [Portunus trituberculatus]
MRLGSAVRQESDSSEELREADDPEPRQLWGRRGHRCGPQQSRANLQHCARLTLADGAY